MANTLRWVPNLHWILIEDSGNKTSLVKNFLTDSGISHTHLNSKTPKLPPEIKHRGVMQRNAGLNWLRDKKINSGVVYFADDDNTYDIRIFEELRYTNVVSVWPVGLVGGLKYETPVVEKGQVIDFWSVPKGRTFAIDMAGFAVSVKLLIKKPSAKFRLSASNGFLEDDLLKQLEITLSDLDPKADECTKVLVWHTKTVKSNLESEYFMSINHGRKSRSLKKIIEV